MIEYAGQEGGRYTYIDDILNLQNLALAFNSIFSGCDNFIISGCVVSGSTISDGYVYINGKIRYFAGATGQSTFPVYIYESNSVQNVAYADSADKVGRNIYSCLVGTSIPTAKDAITGKVPQAITVTSTSALRLNDAFFGKYALMINSPRTQQNVENKVVFGDDITFSGDIIADGQIRLIKGSSEFTISYDDSGNLTLQSSLSGKSPFKFVFANDGVFRFYVGSTLCAEIDSNGMKLNSNSQTSDFVQGGNIAINESDIFNKGIATNDGAINFNTVGFNGGTGYYRNFNVYDGKKNLIFQLNGSSGQSFFYGTLNASSSSSNGINLCNTSYSKASVELQKLINWSDKDNANIAFIGYNLKTDSVFRITNSIGNIEITPTAFCNIVGEIQENGVALREKYITRAEADVLLGSKGDAISIYTKTECDNQFITFKGGLDSLITYMTNNGDSDAKSTIRTSIGAASTTDTDKLYVTKTAFQEYVSSIYTGSQSDNRFITLSGGIKSLLDYMTTNGDTDAKGTVRTLIEAASIADTDKLYVTKTQYQSDLAGMYTGSESDNKFITFSGGIASILNYMTSKGDGDSKNTVRNLIGATTLAETNSLYLSKTKYLSDVATTDVIKKQFRDNIGATSKSETDGLYISKTQFLSDIATNDNQKKQICTNIGAAYTDDVQLKIKDSGWLQLSASSDSGSTALNIRQIGNIVSIQGTVGQAIAKDKVLFTIPNNIDNPKYSCTFEIGQYAGYSNSRGWRVVLDSNGNCTVVEDSNKPLNFVFSLTYMV